MKLNFLNSLPKRLGFSVGLAAFILLLLSLIYGSNYISIFTVLLIGLAVYVLVTVFYAVISTFFETDKKEQNDEVLDD